MKKTIWYISKYCKQVSENSPGSRGWLLMKEFAAKGYQSLVITSDSNDITDSTDSPDKGSKFKQLSKEGVDLLILKTLKYSISKSVMRIFSWFDFELNLFLLNKKKLSRPDVIIISSLSLLTILNGVFLKKKYRCKLVFEIRDIWPLTLVEEGGFSPNNLLIKFLGFIERWGYKKSDLIVGTMPKLDEHVRKILGYEKPVKCIPMGLDPSMLINNPNEEPEYIKLHLKPGYFNIVYAGSIGITNALDTFFKAADILKNNSKIRFVIIGDGALKNEYIKKYGYLSNLVYFPRVHKNQVKSFLAHADLVYFSVFKSKVWDYGQSLNKIIDYMISQKPIIASYSGYPSMINEADCGYFVPAEDPLSLAKKIEEMSTKSQTELNIIGSRGLSWLKKNRLYEKLANDYLKLLFEKDT